MILGHFGPNLGSQYFLRVFPLLVIRHYRKLSSYATYKKTNAPKLRKWQKTEFWTQFWLILPKFGLKSFFNGFYLY